MVHREIVQKVIDLLKADVNLAEPSRIAKYHFGIPVAYMVYPAIAVQDRGRTSTGKSNIGSSNEFLYDLHIDVVVVDRSVVEDEAEKSVQDKIEVVETVLRSNSTLDGYVSSTKLPWDIAVEVWREGDYSVSARVLSCVWRKWMS